MNKYQYHATLIGKLDEPIWFVSVIADMVFSATPLKQIFVILLLNILTFFLPSLVSLIILVATSKVFPAYPGFEREKDKESAPAYAPWASAFYLFALFATLIPLAMFINNFWQWVFFQ